MDTEFHVALMKITFTFGLIVGLVIFASLVGIITSNFESFIESIEEGSSKVMEHDHTLILGFSEGTARVVAQLAFLHRSWRVLNDSWEKKLMPWTRVPPSTPVAKNTVVILCQEGEKTKKDIDALLEDTLTSVGISPKRTKVGWDVVVRMGDPTAIHDLVRVNAGAATSILVMMTEEDREQEEESGGKVVNGATIRTLLALRNVMCSDFDNIQRFDEDDVRIVVQLGTTRYVV